MNLDRLDDAVSALERIAAALELLAGAPPGGGITACRFTSREVEPGHFAAWCLTHNRVHTHTEPGG
jgi:hypothetical protein